jgi:excisionase family DNA binding protein
MRNNSATRNSTRRLVTLASSAGVATASRPVGIREAAKYLCCSTVTVRRRAKDGSLPHYRIHGRLMFDRADLRRFMQACREDARELVSDEQLCAGMTKEQ